MLVIPIHIIVMLLAIHFIADFLLQTDWMAQNKSKQNMPLLIHVTVYSIPLFLFALFFMSPVTALLFAVLNFVLHFVTDYLSSRATTYLYHKGDRHNFFVVIGFDQFAHYVAMFTTWAFLMG